MKRVTLIAVATTTLAADAQVARRTTGATRHSCVITRFAVFFLLCWRNVCDRWQVDFRQFSTLSRRALRSRLGGDSVFDDWRCDSFCFRGCRVCVTNFLAQLTLFAARLRLTNAFFLFRLLSLLLIQIQRLDFLLCLTFFIVATTVAFTTRRLLLVTGLRLIGNVVRLLAVVTRFCVLLLRLTTVTTVVITVFTAFSAVVAIITVVTAIVTVAAIILARLTTILLTLRFFLCFRCRLFNRL